MVAVITAALVTLYSAATAEGEAIVRRIHNATIALVTLDSQMLGRSVPASVPEAMYCECKSLYMMLRCPLAAVVSPPLMDPPRGRATARCRGRRPRPGELRQEDVAAVFGVTRQTVEAAMGCRVERSAPAGYARPLIEPYVQFSRIRLSVWDWFHRFRSPSTLGSVSH